MKALTVGVLVVVLALTAGCRRETTPAAATGTQAVPAPAAAPVGGSIAELPDYPGASRVAYSEKGPSDDYVRRAEASFISTDTLPAVKAFYQNVVATGGWTVVELKDKPDEAEWKLAKGMAVAEIEIDVKAPGTVAIRLLRKDR